MSIKMKNITGDLAVSRHVAIAGELTSNGNAVFGRNVQVKGWLDAPNIKHAYKGLYPSVDALETAYPRPQAGWYACVAEITTVTTTAEDGTETTKAALTDKAVVWLALRADGGRYEWTATNLYTDGLNAYVEDVEAAIEAAVTSCLQIIHDGLDDPVIDADDMDGLTELRGRTRWAVTRTNTAGKTFKTGTLDLFSDNDSHVLTQVYTTHETSSAADGEPIVFNGSHKDNTIFWYVRSYVIQNCTLDTAAGNWTAWTLAMASTTEARLVTLEEKAATDTDITADEPLHVKDQSVTKNKVTFQLTIDEATTTARGTLSAGDKTKLDALDTAKVVQEQEISGTAPLTLTGKITNGKLFITGDVAAATQESAGTMSAADKKKLDSIDTDTLVTVWETTGLTLLDEDASSDDISTALAWDGTYTSAAALFDDKMKKGAVVRDSIGSGTTEKYVYLNVTSVKKNSGGGYVITLADMTANVVYTLTAVLKSSYTMTYTFSLAVTQLMTAADKKTFDNLTDWLKSGAVTHGTMRFHGVHCFASTTSTLIEDEDAGGYDGIVWLTDKKMFVAYRALELIDSDEEQYIYWTHWDTAADYMETIGQEGGLWKDKVYICFGYVWVWKRCDTQLVRAGGGEEFDVITEEEIDELLADFEFVDAETFAEQGIINIEAEGDDVLTLDATKNATGNEVKIKGDIDKAEITKEEVDEWFDTVNPDDGTGSLYLTTVKASGDDVLTLNATKDGNTAVITGGINKDALASELTKEEVDEMFEK